MVAIHFYKDRAQKTEATLGKIHHHLICMNDADELVEVRIIFHAGEADFFGGWAFEIDFGGNGHGDQAEQEKKIFFHKPSRCELNYFLAWESEKYI